MGSWAVWCGSCELRWPRVENVTDYEQQAIESRPCPYCGAYTLSCTAPTPAARRRRDREHTRPRQTAA